MPGALLSAAAWDPRGDEQVHIERFITSTTYSLVKEGSIDIDFLSEKKNPGVLQLYMVPFKRQMVKPGKPGKQ
jgi:hypothetical protein